ncbi:MAG: hypothetical protein JHD16_18855, partial [Solirubrobacteraceae bacterium]|nr:hypothetical protein [Solirubrobacteraceae bacterium]
LGASPSLAATKKAKCAPGTFPVVTGSGKQAKLAKKKGKVRCKAVARPKITAVERPAASSPGVVASTTDQLTQALTVKPTALAITERRIGKRATAALIDQGMNAWRKAAGAQVARRLEGGFKQSTTFGDPAKGTAGSARIEASDVTANGKLGIQASGAVEFTADTKGLKELGADKVTDAKNAKIKIEIDFSDLPDACPDASGKVNGKLVGEAKLTITTDGVSQTIAAKVDASYSLTVGQDARWKTIDNVDVQTTFTFGGSKQGSETWRGREVGSGFGQKGLLDTGVDFSQAYTEATSHVDWTKGGIFGPHSRVNNSTGPTAWDIRSISNLKGLLYTQTATHLLTLAAVEYVRKVVADRVQKHWYDDEACLKLESKSAASKLRAGQTTTVTALNAKAANGSPVAVDLKGSGVAKLEPGTASMAAGGTKDFTLTAPNATPTRSSWTIVGTGVAGKKTVTGNLGDEAAYSVKVQTDELGIYAGHTGTAKLDVTAEARPFGSGTPQKWTGGQPLIWSAITQTSTTRDCTLTDPVQGGSIGVTITDAGSDTITV